MQLVHVSQSSCHSAVPGTQLDKECYDSITHSSALSHNSYVSPAFERLPALPLQASLTRLHKDGSPTAPSQAHDGTRMLLGDLSGPSQSTLLLLGGVS